MAGNETEFVCSMQRALLGIHNARLDMAIVLFLRPVQFNVCTLAAVLTINE